MKLKFLGRGGAFAPLEIGQSNMVFISDAGKIMLFDCGTAAPYMLAQNNISHSDINSVYISHQHADHIGGLEWLGFTCFFSNQEKKPTLYCEQQLSHDLWEHSLRGGMESLQGVDSNLETYFNCEAIDMKNPEFTWEGYNFRVVKTLHVASGTKELYSYGLVAWNSNNRGKKIYITSDSQFSNPSPLQPVYDEADMIFHDCDTGTTKSIVHANYFDMRDNMSDEVKSKTYLYHYAEPMETFREDGFAGFVNTRDEFEF